MSATAWSSPAVRKECDVEVDVEATQAAAREAGWPSAVYAALAEETRLMSFRVGIDIGGTFTDFALLSGTTT